MKILKDQLLSNYSSMRIGGKAKFLCHAEKKDDFLAASEFARKNSLKVITIGRGTNIIFTDSGFNGLVVVNNYQGHSIEGETISANSGSSWDEIVAESVAKNLVGIEALSLVPGTVGGAPVNNIGAYGQEIKDTLLFVTALNNKTGAIEKIDNHSCGFSYRNSIFKEKHHGKYQILEVVLGLKKFDKSSYKPPQYPAVQQALEKYDIVTPKIVRETIINIRQSKLPDPNEEPNTGSFFKNPIINKESFDIFHRMYPNAPYYQVENNYKVPAGWLIDNLHLKGSVINGIEIYSKQALVLVNRSATSFKELDLTIKHIQTAVKNAYNISISVEPEIIYND